MKNFLTLIICWLLAFETIAATTVKIKTAQSVAGGYITSQNKVDGSFEDGTTGWVASVGTITASASTEFQGNFKGVWAGTGTGTLDLLWTATASNTYEASAQIKLDVPSDYTLCAVVNGTETGCKVLSGYVANKIYKASVIADSVLGTSFYLRLKHTGSGAFSATVDDGKIEPQGLQNVQVVEQGSVSYTGYSSGTNPVVFKTKDTQRSNEKNLIAVSTVGSAGTASRYTVLKPCNISISASVDWSDTNKYTTINHYNSSGTIIASPLSSRLSDAAQVSYVSKANAGDYFQIGTDGSTLDNISAVFNITATAISDNVIQSYSNDRVGETIYSIQNTAPQGFISAQGSILGKTSGSHQGEAYKALYDYSWAIASATAGEPYLISSAKGASAQADWDANKTIKIDLSGLFLRVSGGNAGVVGAKQADAFQGHKHESGGQSSTAAFGKGATSYGGGLFYSSATNGFVNLTNTPYEDGTNGTPRTASETRPVNTSLYAYIRYAQSMPTLLALPAATQTEYYIEAGGNAGQSITAEFTDIPFIATTQTNLTWDGSGFTAPISGNYEIFGSVYYTTTPSNLIRLFVNNSHIKNLSTLTANGVTSTYYFSGKVYLTEGQRLSFRASGGGTLINDAKYHNLTITRLNGKNDGVFVGNVAKNQVAIVQYRGTRTTLSTTPVAMPLTTVKGDTSIVSIASNQFTLQAGEYDIETYSFHFVTGGTAVTRISYLHNVTDSTYVDYDTDAYSSSTTAYAPSRGATRISLTTQKTFEYRHYISGAATAYLGNTNSFPNDLNGFIKITKLNGQ